MIKKLFWKGGKRLFLTEYFNNRHTGLYNNKKKKKLKIVDLTPSEIKRDCIVRVTY